MKRIIPLLLVLLFKGISSVDIGEIHNASSICGSRATCVDGRKSRLDLVMDWKDVNCFCDDLCMQYGDCCPSSNSFDPFVVRNSPSTFQCVSINNYVSYYMKGQCDQYWTDDFMANLCMQSSSKDDSTPKDPFLRTPVTSTFTDITYRNYFCALCNYESLKDIEPWEARVSCQTADNVDGDYIRDNLKLVSNSWGFVEKDGRTVHYCDIYPSVKETISHKLRKCKDYVATCNDEWVSSDVADLCTSYTTIVFGPLEQKTLSNGVSQIGPSIYRNYHCAQCNFVNESDITCYERDFRAGYPGPISFSTLFDFGTVNSVCDEGYIWDSFFKKCRAVFCLQQNYEYNSGRCVKTYTDGDEDEQTTPVPDDTEENFNSSSIKCDQMFFDSSEYSFGENDTVVIIPYRKSYEADEYEFFEDGIVVCVPDNFSRLMGWLTLLGIGLSCICILCHLIMFALVPELRNLSGKNLASMCIALLIGYVCFLITTFRASDSGNCRLIGSIMYYGFMSSFTWMNVMAYDVWRTLQMATYQLRLTAGKQWNKFFAYSLYAWIIPLVLLSAIWYIDIWKPDFVSDYLSPDLGERHCWFGQRQGILLYFAAPLTTIMVLNIIFFGMSIKFVAMSARMSSHLTSNKVEQVQLKLYLRLALLMGISWASGIVAGYIQIEYIWYVFILLNAFQGVYILLGFTCTKRVYKAVDKMMGKGSAPKKARKGFHFSNKRGVDCNDSVNSNVTNSTSLSNSISPVKA